MNVDQNTSGMLAHTRKQYSDFIENDAALRDSTQSWDTYSSSVSPINPLTCFMVIRGDPRINSKWARVT